MSAWHIFTALGFYPVNPASGEYLSGSPLFPRASIHLANGKTFTVEAENVSNANVYIQSATLNGSPLTRPVITWEDIQAGGTLHFVMGRAASKWAADWHPNSVEDEVTSGGAVDRR
jgi:putative alpha-1,2-mannosidase